MQQNDFNKKYISLYLLNILGDTMHQNDFNKKYISFYLLK